MSQPIRSRRLAREKALQALYASEQGGHPPDEAIEMTIQEVWVHPDTVAFARRLAIEAYEDAEKWHGIIGPFLAGNWSMDRLAVMDRLCLVLAAAEFYTEPGVPPLVTLTEWVKFAKTFGHKDSSAFVHGVLSKVLAGSPKATWDPTMEDLWTPEAAEEDEVEEVEVTPDDPELEKAMKAGAWVIRKEF